MKYLITGNSFPIKDELKSFGCIWKPEKKAWETILLTKDEIAYKRLKSLCDTFDLDMNPVKLDPECEKIQRILNNEK